MPNGEYRSAFPDAFLAMGAVWYLATAFMECGNMASKIQTSDCVGNHIYEDLTSAASDPRVKALVEENDRVRESLIASYGSWDAVPEKIKKAVEE